MFYFCDEPVPFPKGDDLEQLAKVVRFREELASKGYTLSYPTRIEFRDHVRSGILRAVADLLRDRGDQELTTSLPRILPLTEEKDAVAEFARQYDEIRRAMPSSRERTKKMGEIAAALRLIRAAAVRSLLPEYQRSTSPGLRLAAISILQQFPNAAELDWLAERLDPDKEAPFVGYGAAVELTQAVRSLPLTDPDVLRGLKRAINHAQELAARNPHDPPRIRVLATALDELEARHEYQSENKVRKGKRA